MCFVDYEKTFDHCKHKLLMTRMNDIGLDGKKLWIIINLYENQKATVRLEYDEIENMDVFRGVGQECILIPLLFNVYFHAVILEAFENWGETYENSSVTCVMQMTRFSSLLQTSTFKIF